MQMMVKFHPVAVILLLAHFSGPSIALAAKTFTNVSGSDWNTSANWGGVVPATGEDVIINGIVMLTNATPALASYTLNAGKTHTCDGWETVLSAAVVNVSGTLTHMSNSDMVSTDGWTPNARVRIVCEDLSIPVGGSISVLGKGFQGGVYTNGYGPGRGMARRDRGGGGGYGGPGTSAVVNYGAYGGPAYGSASLPDMPGSGGGSTFTVLNSTGGAGGGLVQIVATGDVGINGTITADGANGVNHCPGAGSGGGVYIRCATLAGSGTISAKGGSSFVGGGGGRIAIDITDATAQATLSPTLKFTAESVKGNGDTRYHPGSLYFSRKTFFPYETLSYGSYMLSIGGITTLSVPSLTVTAGEPWMPTGVKLDIAANFTVRNSGTLVIVTNSDLSCAGNLVVENAGRLQMHSSPTNGAAPGYGNLTEVDGTLKIAANSYLYVYSHPINGGSLFFDIADLDIDVGGTLDANGKGFSGGVTTQNGYGPGGGVFMGWPADRGGGGGYGGRGATHTYGFYLGVSPRGGPAYGQANAPTLCGSGGAGKSGKTGGFGGGLIWMRVRQSADIDGVLTANGTVAPEWTCADGSGGGVFLDCGGLSGSGTITANGGVIANTQGANGGGGRIAVWQGVTDHYRPRFLSGNFSGAIVSDAPPATFSGTVAAARGTVGYTGYKAETGSVVFLTAPATATLLVVR